MKTKNLVILISFCLFLSGSINLIAHDFWVCPEKYLIDKGEKVSIYLNNGMIFPISLNAVDPERFSELALITCCKTDLKEFKIDQKSTVTSASFVKERTSIISAIIKPRSISLSAEDFNMYLKHDGLSKVYDYRVREGIENRDAVEQYSKYAKSIVQVGSEYKDVSMALGHKIEFIPLTNPYTLKQGDKLPVELLFDGKPLVNAEIGWSYTGLEETFAGTIVTDAEGKALIPLEKAGPYVVRVTHMEHCKKPEYEWESFWASLTFEVQ